MLAHVGLGSLLYLLILLLELFANAAANLVLFMLLILSMSGCLHYNVFTASSAKIVFYYARPLDI